MDVTIEQNGSKEPVNDITLAEQTRGKVYTEDEDEPDNDSEEHMGASLVAAVDCVSAGYIDEDDGETILNGVTYIEQEDSNTVYVEFRNGKNKRFTGEFDRAYAY